MTSIDIEDDEVPFRVVDDSGGVTWAEEVEPADRPRGADREALVTRAKELLAGTEHTAADVIAMAAFLAGD
ncbi:hypothetical protein [Streptomyces sp. NRRL S-378]|uniref:hypothetical protein n=1 Tax=Streptomyces sp. NRRL S-378 TaxID=1463904 RepID=UPI0004C4A9AE|nr:hypothetical protein [Streptomyces sp. NRRL S-378]